MFANQAKKEKLSKIKKKENFSLKDILRSLSCPPCHDQPLRTESAVCMIQGSKR